jgi:hypothetical protein
MRASQLKTRIRQVDPIRERRRLLLLSAMWIALPVVGFLLGRHWSPELAVPLTDAAEPLRAQVTQLETRLQIDRETIAALRSDLADANARLDELQRELAFYRGVMAPEALNAELLLREPTLVRLSEPGRWRYQLVVQQGGRNDIVRKGTLTVSVVGVQGDVPAVHPLSALTEDLDDNALSLGFRYFQKFDGVLVLPDGFQPEAIELEATLKQPTEATVKRRFDWPSGDRSASMAPTDPEE